MTSLRDTRRDINYIGHDIVKADISKAFEKYVYIRSVCALELKLTLTKLLKTTTHPNPCCSSERKLLINGEIFRHTICSKRLDITKS